MLLVTFFQISRSLYSNFNLFDSVEISMSGDRQSFTIDVPLDGITPFYSIIDYRDKINDAQTSDEIHLWDC